MTNFDKIKNMSVEELADTIANAMVDCVWCPISEFCALHNNDTTQEFDSCSESWEQWLKSEVKE